MTAQEEGRRAEMQGIFFQFYLLGPLAFLNNLLDFDKAVLPHMHITDIHTPTSPCFFDATVICIAELQSLTNFGLEQIIMWMHKTMHLFFKMTCQIHLFCQVMQKNPVQVYFFHMEARTIS